jgi:hypothetical protein
MWEEYAPGKPRESIPSAKKEPNSPSVKNPSQCRIRWFSLAVIDSFPVFGDLVYTFKGGHPETQEVRR